MTIRELYGMTYESIELSHPVTHPLHFVLQDLARWLDDNGHKLGFISSLTTQTNPDDESEFLTTLVWSET